MEKTLILEGLSCAHCAAQIEDQAKGLDGVKEINLDFVTKKLKIVPLENQNTEELTEKIKAVVKNIEPDVIIIDESPVKEIAATVKNQVLILEGLDCAHCASLIENMVKGMPDMEEANFDFMNKKLTMKTAEDPRELFPKVEQIVKMLEPEVKVIPADDQNIEVVRQQIATEADKKQKIELAKLIVGGLIFLVGFLGGFSKAQQLPIFLTAYAIVGYSVVIRAFKGIIKGQVFSEHFLMTIATVGAFFVGEYPEGVAVMLFYLLGELFQDLAVNRSRRSISELMNIRPDYANLKLADGFRKVNPEEVRIGDIIMVLPGEKVPLDGTVIEGSSWVDTSALTGESVPRQLEVGLEALSGFINQSGVLTIEVNKTFGESTVSKILELVENAASRKAPTENFISKFARYYTPAVVFGALAVAFIPPLLISGATFSEWIYRALIFLVISCPCALVISIPLGFFGGIGGASKRGILVKGSNYLEALNNVEIVIFDKTGTLTKGVFQVSEIKPSEGFGYDELLELAAHAESLSKHPIAQSIVKAYKNPIAVDAISDYEEIAGHGVAATFAGKRILAGNKRLMQVNDIVVEDPATIGSLVHLAVDNKYAGYIVVSDELKPDAVEAISKLRQAGVKNIAMLTGDRKNVADEIGRILKIDKVYSELLPAQKIEKLEEIESQKEKTGKLVFVGDGINEAPVLARADIGIAMGALGSDAAIEAADVVLMTDEPSKVATAIAIADKTKNVAWQNIAFAMGVKGIFLILGAAGHATMWEAVFADVGVAIIAILNAMRVMNTKSL